MRGGLRHLPGGGDDSEGHDAGAYYVEALPSYYLDAEPPGRWHGRGADMLGVRSEIRDEDFLDIMAGVHPGSRGVLLGRAYGESSVRGFVPLTRGRHHNDAYITTTGEQTAVDVFAESIARSWIDQPTLARQAELAGTDRHRPGTLPPAELQALLGEQAQLIDTLHQLDKTIRDETGQLHELRNDLTDARRLRARRPEMDSRLEDVGSQLADDRRIRTRQLRRNPPERITNTIGQLLATSDRIRAWDNAVGYLDQHQAAHGLTAGLGPTQGPSVTKAFLHSRALAASTANNLAQDNGIDHANVMRIGR